MEHSKALAPPLPWRGKWFHIELKNASELSKKPWQWKESGCWLFSSSFLHKRTTFNVGRRERVTQFQPDVLFFYSLKFCIWFCWLSALHELTVWHPLLSAPIKTWDSLCHDFSCTKVLRPSFLIAPEVTFHVPLPLFPGPLIWNTFCLLPCTHRLGIALCCLSFNIQSKPLFL